MPLLQWILRLIRLQPAEKISQGDIPFGEPAIIHPGGGEPGKVCPYVGGNAPFKSRHPRRSRRISIASLKVGLVPQTRACCLGFGLFNKLKATISFMQVIE